MSDKTEPSGNELFDIYMDGGNGATDAATFRHRGWRALFRAGVATHNTVSREQIAEAMQDADYDSWNDGTTWQKLSERQKDEYRKLADAVLALLVPTSKETKP